MKSDISDQAPSDDDTPKSKLNIRIPGCLGCVLLVLLGVAGVTAFVYFEFNPRDRVQVSIEKIPLGTRFLCVVAKTDRGLKAMDWSPRMIGPLRIAPREGGGSYRPPDNIEPHAGHVFWEFGSRYGVVRRDVGQKWWITWFNPDEVAMEGRKFFLGGGTVALDVTKGQTEELSRDDVRHLGFEGIRFQGEK